MRRRSPLIRAQRPERGENALPRHEETRCRNTPRLSRTLPKAPLTPPNPPNPPGRECDPTSDIGRGRKERDKTHAYDWPVRRPLLPSSTSATKHKTTKRANKEREKKKKGKEKKKKRNKPTDRDLCNRTIIIAQTTHTSRLSVLILVRPLSTACIISVLSQRHFVFVPSLPRKGHRLGNTLHSSTFCSFLGLTDSCD